jgi:hypothetical protein
MKAVEGFLLLLLLLLILLLLGPVGLLYEPGFGISRLYCQEPPRLHRRERPPSTERGNYGREMPCAILPSNSCLKGSFTCRKSWTDGFTSPPKGRHAEELFRTRELGYQGPAC